MVWCIPLVFSADLFTDPAVFWCPSNLLCHDIGCEVLDGYKASQLLSMSEDDLVWKLMKLGTQWTNNLGRFEHGTLRL